jgi:bifunctional non-homologous end joining protein LigD
VISHPEKLLFPIDGITKGEIAAYYEAVAPLMLPGIKGRPVTMERYPSGIGKAGFMQKDVSRAFPMWLKRVEVPKKGGVVNYPLIDDLESLLWLANQNCITVHVWTSRVPRLYYPDVCVFDLDPMEEELDVLRTAALAVRDLLAELGLQSWVKTSGSKGFHILVPLDGKASYDEVARFTDLAGQELVRRDPDHLTQEFVKADRGGRILVDTWRNAPGATFAATYTVRPKPGAPISAPCSWEELATGAVHPQSFNVRNMAERLETAGDLFAEMRSHRYSLKRPMQRLEKLAAANPGDAPRISSRGDYFSKVRSRS